MLTLILADTELELMPPEVADHATVRAHAKRAGHRPKRMLLDGGLHREAMKGLPDFDRRGRPDMVHLFLLTALDSVLNRKGLLRVLVHTRNDELVRIDPSTRLMRNYVRFTGLMEQLFAFGRVPTRGGAPLMTIERPWPLAKVVALVGAKRIIGLERGPLDVSLAERVRAAATAGDDVSVLVGGFPRGDFRSPVKEVATEWWTMGPDMLSVWTVAAELIVHWEEAVGAFAMKNAFGGRDAGSLSGIP